MACSGKCGSRKGGKGGKRKLFGGTYVHEDGVTPNLVGTTLEKEVLSATFKGTRQITAITFKVGQIAEAYSKATNLSDIVESTNYTPVTLTVPSTTDWDVLEDESLAFSLKTRQLTFAVSGGDCQYNCFYAVDQSGNLLSVSAKLANVVTKTVDFTAYYKFYCLQQLIAVFNKSMQKR